MREDHALPQLRTEMIWQEAEQKRKDLENFKAEATALAQDVQQAGHVKDRRILILESQMSELQASLSSFSQMEGRLQHCEEENLLLNTLVESREDEMAESMAQREVHRLHNAEEVQRLRNLQKRRNATIVHGNINSAQLFQLIRQSSEMPRRALPSIFPSTLQAV